MTHVRKRTGKPCQAYGVAVGHAYGIPRTAQRRIDIETDPNITGRTLKEVNEGLYRETLDGLLLGATSGAGASIDSERAKLIAHNLASARIVGRCACGQDDCRSYYFEVPAKERGVRYETVRLHARGEHLVHIDSDGDVYEVERLYDLGNDPTPKLQRQGDDTWQCISFPAANVTIV